MVVNTQQFDHHNFRRLDTFEQGYVAHLGKEFPTITRQDITAALEQADWDLSAARSGLNTTERQSAATLTKAFAPTAEFKQICAPEGKVHWTCDAPSASQKSGRASEPDMLHPKLDKMVSRTNWTKLERTAWSPHTEAPITARVAHEKGNTSPQRVALACRIERRKSIQPIQFVVEQVSEADLPAGLSALLTSLPTAMANSATAGDESLEDLVGLLGKQISEGDWISNQDASGESIFDNPDAIFASDDAEEEK